jgi:hypothetical protein
MADVAVPKQCFKAFCGCSMDGGKNVTASFSFYFQCDEKAQGGNAKVTTINDNSGVISFGRVG